MRAKSGFTKDEIDAWLGYERSFVADCDEKGAITDFHDLEADDCSNEWGNFGEYRLVGNGQRTNEKCGKFYGFYGCLNVDLHDKITLDGVSHKGKVFVRKFFHSCDKPTCPICFKRGWAVREASAIERRLAQCSKRFGVVEHIIISVPEADYGLSFEKLKAKTIKILANRGVHGGVLIFHAFRYRNSEEAFRKCAPMGWYWSPHFHCLGYIKSGYSKCRHCIKSSMACLSCDGFEGRTRRCYEKEGGRSGSGYIVKVAGKRKSIHGTAWYQLNHSSFKVSSKRPVIATWFGTCSYHKLKVTKDKKEGTLCPICQHELEKLHYVGERPIKEILSEFWIKEFEDDLLDWRGFPKWIKSSH